MYENFEYKRVALAHVHLDERNPRIVNQSKMASEQAIAGYFFAYEDLASFIKMIVVEGRNPGAERPYVVKNGKNFIVVEGNTRIATYKLLTGQIIAPEMYKNLVPLIPEGMRKDLLSVDVAIAPSRDSLMTIMARSHFGRGEKSKWGYLGSRKAVFDDWKAGRSILDLSQVFGRPQSLIRDLILEYMLYIEATKLEWTPAEREVLLRPSLEFNPPVRFLQSTGHKQLVGIEQDKLNLEIKFTSTESRSKFKHLVKRTVIDEGGPSATSSYDEVFSNFQSPKQPATESNAESGGSGGEQNGMKENGHENEEKQTASKEKSSSSEASNSQYLKPNALFNYKVGRNDLTLNQLMKEARDLNTKRFPAAGSALLRSVVEVLLKLIIEEKNLNGQGKLIDIEGALNLVIGAAKLPVDDVKILKEFKLSHLSYVNLSTHATVVPNYDRLKMARDCIDAFLKRNI